MLNGKEVEIRLQRFRIFRKDDDTKFKQQSNFDWTRVFHTKLSLGVKDSCYAEGSFIKNLYIM